MRTFPMTFVQEFKGSDTSYRISANRARNYWEFLEHIHDTFSKPWERYNAHLHFDKGRCDGRISPSEWDAGGYFEAEFVVDGRLVIYAHFEAVNDRIMESSGVSTLDEVEKEGEAWYWGMYGEESVRVKNRSLHEEIDDDDYREGEEVPYPPFPETLSSDGNNLLPLSATAIAACPNVARPEITTVDDTDSDRQLDTGCIIGRALPKCCRDPNLRPVVRAFLNKVGSVVAYIPGKYAKRTVGKGDVQISMKDVEYTEELGKIPFGLKRTTAIKAKLEVKNAPVPLERVDPLLPTSTPPSYAPSEKNQTGEFITIDDCQSQRLLLEGIVIGHPKPYICCEPDKRPLVRAILDTRNNVMAFAPAKYIITGQNRRDAQVAMKDVDFAKEFAEIPPSRMSDAIRKRIQEKKVEKEMREDQAPESEETTDSKSQGAHLAET